jgi:hypothetical protein
MCNAIKCMYVKYNVHVFMYVWHTLQIPIFNTWHVITNILQKITIKL